MRLTRQEELNTRLDMGPERLRVVSPGVSERPTAGSSTSRRSSRGGDKIEARAPIFMTSSTSLASANSRGRLQPASLLRNLLIAATIVSILLQLLSSALLLVETKANQRQIHEWAANHWARSFAPNHRQALLERRGGAEGNRPGVYHTVANGARTQLAISVERVKNPDDEESYDGTSYKPKKKKKFPVRWLRNQYPFKGYLYAGGNKNKYKSQGADLEGQYSSQNYDVLDPNPSTWVRIPDRPTASIKFNKQSSSLTPADIQLPPAAASLMVPQPQMMGQYQFTNPRPFQQQQQQQQFVVPPNQMMLMPSSPFYMRAQQAAAAPTQPQVQPNAMMTSESRENYVGPTGGRQVAAIAKAPPTGEGGEQPASGFGGISLSFGNGRSISFGGGQGLTIGGRAGAIQIGRNAGRPSSDNAAAASGYSETKGGHNAAPSAGSGQTETGAHPQSSSSYSSSYGDSYVNKYPTSSVEVPRKGKTIVHANLDMAPIKFRLHSSPRVKITTGSRDPLEKPSDEELTEKEEDIFEEPEPFPKRNTTSSMNETDTSNTTALANGTAMNGVNNMTMLDLSQLPLHPNVYGGNQYYGVNQQHFGQQHHRNLHDQHHHHHHHYQQQQQQQQQQDHFQHYQGALDGGHPAQAHESYPQQGAHFQQTAAGQWPAPATQTGEGQPQQFSQQVPFDEPPQFVQQQQEYGRRPPLPPPGNFINPQQQPQYQMFNSNDGSSPPPPPPPPPALMIPRQPPMEQQPIVQRPQAAMQPQQPLQEQQQVSFNDQDERPAVNQWRQFSRETRPQIKGGQQAVNSIGIDENVKFYNSGGGVVPPLSSNSIAMEPQQQQQPAGQMGMNMMMGGPEQRDAKDQVETAASSQTGTVAKPARQYGSEQQPGRSHQQEPRVSSHQHEQFNPSTLYQVVPSGGANQQQQPYQANIGLGAISTKSQVQPIAPAAVAAANPAGKGQAPGGQLQPESSYHVPTQHHQHHEAYQQQQQSSNGGGHGGQQEDGYKTYTIGSGGISSHYSDGGGSSSYGSSSYGGGAKSSYGGYGGYGGGGLVPSDGFDQKHYQAKVEKFDPDAHDKRERTKVVLFLKPRISIHMANSSTTTPRPKNPQRLVHVINRPIFLNMTHHNSTNASHHHHDDDFIDPDLAEPMDVYAHGYGYGYGHGYTKGYKTKTSTSTTKKPKPKTTTTTTTAAPTESETTTTTTSSPSSSEAETTTTTTAAPSSTESEDSPSTSTTESSSTTSGGDSGEVETSSASSSVETTSPATATTSEQPPAAESSASTEDAGSGGGSSTESASEQETSSASPVSSESTSTKGEVELEDLVASATEEAPVSVASPTTTTQATTTSTTTTTTTRAPPPPPTSTSTTTTTTSKAPIKSRNPPAGKSSRLSPAKARKVPASTTTTTTTTTTTSTTTTTTTTTPPPEVTTTTTTSPQTEPTEQEQVTTTTATVEPVDEQTEQTAAASSSTSTSTTTSTVAPSESTPAEQTSESPAEISSEAPASSAAEDIREQPQVPAEQAAATTTTTTTTTAEPQQDDQQEEVGREVGQRDDTNFEASRARSSRSSPQQQHRPMLLNEDLIDKLMRNKTLVGLMSSQLKRVIKTEQMDDADKQRIVRQVFVQMMDKKVDFSMNNVRLAVRTVSSSYKAAAKKTSGERSTTAKPKVASPTEKKAAAKRRNATPDSRTFGRRSSGSSPPTSNAKPSRSLPVIDTALKLTAKEKRAAGTRRDSNKNRRLDSSGNPIVVVLVPTEKKA